MIDAKTAKTKASVSYAGTRERLTTATNLRLTGQVSSHSNSALVSFVTKDGFDDSAWVGYSALTLVSTAADAINNKISDLTAEIAKLRDALKIVEALNV